MYSNMLLRYRKYLTSKQMILLCLIGILSSIQATIIDVPDTAASLRGRTLYTLYTDERTWKEARNVCRKNGGYLINIETEEKYQRYLSLKISHKFRTSIATPWIGLYWRSSTDLDWDGPGCPPRIAHLTDWYYWRNENDSKYNRNQACYREKENGFERHKCDQKNTFICEQYTNDTWRYENSTTMSVTVTSLNVTATSLDDCKTNCDNTSGCFLTSNIENACLMLVATDINNNNIAIKNFYETEVNSEAPDVNDDYSDSTDCTNEPPGTLSSTETSTITETAVTGYSANWSTTTEFETDVSTFTVTTTETITTGFSPLVTQTEIRTQFYDTVTVDATGSCSSTVLYSSSPCPSVTVQTMYTTIQSSFSSIQINDTSASSSTGIQGVIGSDGIMRSEVCREVIVVTPDPVAEQAAVESIVNELTVDKKNITAVVQKKVSAQDKRSSSVAIGYIGIVFLIIPFLLIIAVDLPTLIRGGRDVIKFCKDEDIF